MQSQQLGENTSQVEVLNISKHGFWLLVHGEEHFLPFDEFPWFRDARIADILDVQLLRPGHLYWAELDVDLDIQSIQAPEKYPLIYKQ